MINDWPNILTILRIVLIPLIVIFIVTGLAWEALGLYTIACITDYFDGWLARRHQQFSPLGMILDPIADKLLVVTVILTLLLIGHIGAGTYVPAVIIIGREVMVSGLREYLADVKIKVPVSYLAKWKTGVQMVALGFLIVDTHGPQSLYHWQIGGILLWAAAVMTLLTGYSYWRCGLAHIIGRN